MTSGGRQGASTITQQYVTNVANEARISAGREEQVILSGQKNIADKLREMRLALALEKKFTKEEILDLLAYMESGGRRDHPAFKQ